LISQKAIFNYKFTKLCPLITKNTVLQLNYINFDVILTVHLR